MTEQNFNIELRNANASLYAEIETLKKNAISLKSTSDSHYKALSERNAEIEQVHQMLDAVPNPIARQSEESHYSRVDRNAMTRLAAWLSTR